MRRSGSLGMSALVAAVAVGLLSIGGLPGVCCAQALAAGELGPCNADAGSCCQPNLTPGCDDPECCNLVCSIDPFCCEVQWGEQCVFLAQKNCPICQGGDPCGPDAEDCFVPHDTPGCNDPECCNLVCSADPFCCDVAWDQVCVDLALQLCGPPCPWDLDGSGDVGTTDFLALLAVWGTNPGGPPDFDGDGTVGTPDFLELLANWGPCPTEQCADSEQTGPWRVTNTTPRDQSFVQVTFAGTGGGLTEPRLKGVTDADGNPVTCALMTGEILGGNTVRFEWEDRCIPPGANVQFNVCSEFVPIEIAGVEWGPNVCEVTASNIPNNTSACQTTMNGDGTKNIFVEFDFDARFRGNCSCCEYRQQIRGEFKIGGRKVPHNLGGGTSMETDTFHEDCWVDHPADANVYYGHRSEPANDIADTADTYSNPDDRATGCNYEGEDFPGFRNLAAGTTYSFDLDFEGKIIDTCNMVDVETSTWTVTCSGTAAAAGPGTDPLVEVLNFTTINGRDAILGVYLYPGDILTAVGSILNGDGLVPIDAADVSIEAVGFNLLSGPAPGPLPETRLRGASSQAVFDFDYPAGSPDVVTVNFTFGDETQSFDVDVSE